MWLSWVISLLPIYNCHRSLKKQRIWVLRYCLFLDLTVAYSFNYLQLQTWFGLYPSFYLFPLWEQESILFQLVSVDKLPAAIQSAPMMIKSNSPSTPPPTDYHTTTLQADVNDAQKPKLTAKDNREQELPEHRKLTIEN